VSKTIVIYVKFRHDVACQKLLTSANVSRSYSKNNNGTVFLSHGVVIIIIINFNFVIIIIIVVVVVVVVVRRHR